MYYAGFVSVALFVLSYFVPILFSLAIIVLICLVIAILVDSILLFSKRNGISAKRVLPERLSNGDINKIEINFINKYSFKVSCTIIDELPYQFQERNWKRYTAINGNENSLLEYEVKPLERGEYNFGNINLFVTSPLKLVERKYIYPQQKTVKVYPSFIQMKRYQFLTVASSNDKGVKRVRKLGHSLEFEQIKEYVRGDDYRTINWLATARKGDLMVNNYTDERSQQIICMINKGRSMKMPFEGLSLLDYAINATLVFSNIALLKQDRAGLITFAENIDTFLLPDKKPTQINAISENLYKQQTQFLEPDLEKVFSVVRNRITQRSLLILFTNFESLESFERQLPFFKRIAHYHLLIIVFFENTEVKQLTEKKASTIEDVYIKTIGDKYIYEKGLIVKELHKNGIIGLLTAPQNLTVNLINKYLELKQRQSI